ncbi:MAG: LuxR C-terminal-related transcriptional regulator, partial [Planctomycetota bacterium]
TPREREVLSLVAEGASNREIAGMLHIAEKTVKNHVSSLLSRVGVRDRTRPDVRLEASGGVSLDTIGAIAATGVERISIGSITHGARALDVGLDFD